MLEIGLALAHVVVTTLAAVAVGVTLLGSHFPLHHAALRLALQAAVGFLVISYTVFALALVGLAGPAALAALFGLLALVALVWLVRTPVRIGLSLWSPVHPTPPQREQTARRGTRAWPRGPTVLARVSPSGWLLVSLAAVYGSWTMLCATLPASAPDELIHHLAVPRRLLEAGGSVPFPDNIYAYFPALGEMLFLLALGAGGEVAARLLHAAFGGLVALALYGFSRRHLSAAASAWSVAIFLSVPSVMVILPWAYVDLMFTLYAFLAVALLVEYFESGALRWAVLGGTMAGAAFATKYTGLPLVLLLVLFVLADHLRTRRAGLPVAAVALASVGVAIASPYLWRNWQTTGWPLFPFEIGPFDLRSGINWDRDRAALFLTMLASYGSGAVPAGPASPWDALVAPVLVFVAARFGDARWYDGVVGPVFLLVPVLLWHRRRHAGVPFLALFALTSLVYWGLTTRQVRFLIPALPAMSFLLAAALDGRRLRLVQGLVSLGVAVSLAIGVGKVLGEGSLAFWMGAASRDSYLARRVPGYAIYEAANRRLGPDDRLYLLNMRSYGYYLRPDWRGDFVFELFQLEQALTASATSSDLATFFRSRGITHVLIDEGLTYADGVLRANQRAALQDFLTGRAVRLDRVDGRALYQLSR